MVRRESKYLLEMCEGLVYVVLVVEAETTDEYGVDVGAVLAQKVIGDLLGLTIPAKIRQAFCPEKFEVTRGSRDFEGSIKTKQSLKKIDFV